ncbi:VanZ family protein [Zobellia nedashkovskayae]|uniref:VanZ family protein n=1 Tax=Zobellia nedashkovskayae TaxID=2779510 RepID=UPI00188B7968|nr:VanZ family protein [Zobellia nedashkovskayae]
MEDLTIKNKTKFVFSLLFIVGLFLILFLSWKTNPNLKESAFIPTWLSEWTDQIRNNRRRTAVPFVGLGLLIGLYLVIIKRVRFWVWFYTWGALCIIVIIAEAGQYFLPSRSPDIKDVIWGSIGAIGGLLTSFLGWQITHIIKTISYGHKTD